MSNQHHDPSADLAARMNGLGVNGESGYSSPQQQPNSHHQSPVNMTHNYANIQSPPSRAAPGLQSQPYSPFPDQTGYPYYPGNAPGGPLGVGLTSATYATSPANIGPNHATYAYVPQTSDLINLNNSQQTSASYDGSFPTPNELYGGQGDQSQAHHRTNQDASSILQQVPRLTRQPYRPPTGQSAYQQAAMQQANASANGYYNFQDPRYQWVGQSQNMYTHQGNMRKKDGQNNTYNSRNNNSYSFRSNQNVNNSHFGYNDSVTPTRGAFAGTSSGLNPYNASSNLYHLAQAQGYGNAFGYSPGYQNASGFVLRPKRSEDPNVVRSALLEEFRLNKVGKWELRDIFGYLAEFSGDQHGSRFIQQKLEIATPEDRQKLFDEIMPNSYQLMTDVFGNYVTQKMFEYGDQKQKATLAKKMEGHVLALSLQMYGCRVVQKALEHVLVDQRSLLVSELEGHILECVRSSNANHVIQRLIQLGPPQSVPDSFIGHIEELAKHPYGCRVVQKMFENLDESMVRSLLDEMHNFTADLMEDQFGNYVVQSVIIVGKPEDRDKVIKEIKGRVIPFARHKFASNVVEKAILNADESDRKLLIDELVGLKEDGTNQVGMLLRDAFGNFPLQTALKAASPEHRQELLDIIEPLLPQVRNTPVGKKLEVQIEELKKGNDQSANGSSVGDSTTDTNGTDTTPGGLTMSRSTSEETSLSSPPENIVDIRAKSTTPRVGNGNGAKTLEDLLG
ncbi:uncharacterized protein I206_103151 [Kwoniella pini CBS 10737]|uniref:PUM-HD domain-containing protein n=1 Tax=Kwoniella pini CBS 10737 TaxID=1296096 RepID=A0A1B9IAQ3_9TREE|nr:uncharacterized protein I206_01844 [Kwoniella pini CBS 10737]OCF52553.1 hypothetical protein I206_01844 [Kwoniella pini CBS 10737]